MQIIDQIDRQIDANHRALMARVRCHPEGSVRAWQNAWDRCPDLWKRERALYLARGNAQVACDAEAERIFKIEQRRVRSAARKTRA